MLFCVTWATWFVEGPCRNMKEYDCLFSSFFLKDLGFIQDMFKEIRRKVFKRILKACVASLIAIRIIIQFHTWCCRGYIVQSIEESLWTNQYELIVMRVMRNETTFYFCGLYIPIAPHEMERFHWNTILFTKWLYFLLCVIYIPKNLTWNLKTIPFPRRKYPFAGVYFSGFHVSFRGSKQKWKSPSGWEIYRFYLHL